MQAERAAVDDAVARVRRIREPLGPDNFSEIVAAHGALLDVLAACCNTGKTPRSFAAKYLHFHAPVVPIYDSYAAGALIKLVHWDAAEVAFACPAHGDGEYRDFCVRLYEACCATGLEVSVKTLDAWLWSAPVGG